ncbi:MAG: hypothetical protein AABM32_03250 [Chloroflexota bacterium]
MIRSARRWLLIVDGEILRRVVRSGWRELPLATGAARPSAGDRVDVLATKGPRFVTEAHFAGNAEVAKSEGDVLTIRHRFVAPSGHEPTLTSLGLLRVAVGWTHEILGGQVGAFLPMTQTDHERIEGALRDAALAFGPPPSRSAHRRPRTPGRRALIEGRAAWRPVTRPRASVR